MKNKREDYSVGELVVTGSLWMGAWRWTARLIGFVNTVIIARLLLPDDFGIAATALLVVGFFDTLLDLGTDKYLIRLINAEREDYDTAWTLRLAVMTAASTFIFFAAAPGAALFNDSRLVDVLRVLAFACLLRGFTNIGLMMYRRDLEFRRIALIGLGQRLTHFIATVTFAVLLHNYWAVVLGEVAFSAAEVILSYLFHPYRPRVSITHFAKQWEFSKWIVARNLATVLRSASDQFVVAKYFGTEKMGFYAMSVRFAEMPTKHLVAPMLMPIYAGLAKKQEDPARFTRSVLQVIGAIAAVTLPTATLFMTLSAELVGVVLGANWYSAAPLVAPLVLAATVAVVTEPAVTALTLLGRVRLLAALHWLSGIGVFCVMLVSAQWGDLEQLAITRAALTITFSFFYYKSMRTALALPWLPLIASIYRPVVASVVMGIVTTSIGAASYGPWLSIVMAAAAGSVTYIIVVYGLWRAASSPDAGEALLTRKFWKLIGRSVTRRRR